MTAAKIKIPDKFYYGYQWRRDHIDGQQSDPYKLGFLTPDGTDQAAKKRKDSVDSWASAGRELVCNDIPGQKFFHETGLTFDNVPTKGWYVSRTARRYSTSNVVWRVVHPSGVEIEIPSENMQELIDHCIIEYGEIKGECVIGRTNGNWLLTTTCERYKTAIATTSAEKVRVKPNLGDEVTLSSGEVGIYYGMKTVVAMKAEDWYPGSYGDSCSRTFQASALKIQQAHIIVRAGEPTILLSPKTKATLIVAAQPTGHTVFDFVDLFDPLKLDSNSAKRSDQFTTIGYGYQNNISSYSDMIVAVLDESPTRLEKKTFTVAVEPVGTTGRFPEAYTPVRQHNRDQYPRWIAKFLYQTPHGTLLPYLNENKTFAESEVNVTPDYVRVLALPQLEGQPTGAKVSRGHSRSSWSYSHSSNYGKWELREEFVPVGSEIMEIVVKLDGQVIG